ncbi:MAG: hypothetical protein KGH67_05030 [Candidatus Micrarchaeota archaeon]|nr:hypothetical protein [Candidatus Micrarchaeota archaeon]
MLTNIYLNLTNGNGTVTIGTGFQGTVATDTVQSARQAASYAASYLSLNESKYDFNFIIQSDSANVSGPSAGAAMTLISIAALEHRQLSPNFTITGTISPNGTVGQIGGVFDKVQAAKTINAKFILVPYLNRSDYQYLLYYLSQQTYDVPVIEVKNISQAVPYALGYPAAQITRLNYTLYKNLDVAGLPALNNTCASCNDSAFGQLVNFTFNFTQNEINGINTTKFGNIQAQMQQQLAEYKQIAQKGYLYSAADLAFNEYPVTYVFSNYGNANYTNALAVLNNISAYCNSVGPPPQLTNKNYEFVTGGEARGLWAGITLKAAYAVLNVSQTSDGILALLQSAAPAYSWCLAQSQMYSTASSMGGTPVSLPQSAQSTALSDLRQVQTYGNDLLYVNASTQAYNAGEYAAAIYSADYAQVFYNGTAITNQSGYATQAEVSKALAQADGIWPQQYAYQAQFYLYQSSISNGTAAQSNLNGAYDTALLSQKLDGLDSYLSGNFISGVTTTLPQSNPSASAPSDQVQQNFQLVFGMLIVMTILVLITLGLLLHHILEHKSQKPNPPVSISRARSRRGR